MERGPKPRKTGSIGERTQLTQSEGEKEHRKKVSTEGNVIALAQKRLLIWSGQVRLNVVEEARALV